MSEADPVFGSATKSDWNLGPIFDADAHIDPPHDMWKDYLPASQRDKAPVIEHGEDCDYICFEGNRRPVMMINNQAGRAGKDFKMKGRLSEQRNTYDPAKRLAAYKTVHERIASEHFVIPLYQAAQMYGTSKNLVWTPTPNESIFVNRMSWKD